jgi:putative addiction module component (TIGR02574 family)
MTQLLQKILKLSPSERIIMVEAIWDSLEEKDAWLDISEQTRQLLDRRLDAHHSDPEQGSDWDDTKARIEKLLWCTKSSLSLLLIQILQRLQYNTNT